MGSVELVALADINLRIARNEYVALIGPSGSGKSTIMNVLGCLDLPTTGEYALDGETVAGLSEDQLSCGTRRMVETAALSAGIDRGTDTHALRPHVAAFAMTGLPLLN